ncbi:MAG: hypothetical protein OHK0044_27810 [Burkholderiaceae bacterium]
MKTALAPGVVLLDSVTQTAPAHAGCVVVTGSHAGRSVVKYALAVPAKLYVFNDAGVGKDGAGIAALAELQAHGVAAVAVAHTSARIGEARDTWACGVISNANAAALALGCSAGQTVREAVARIAAQPGSA